MAARQETLKAIIARPPRVIEYPKDPISGRQLTTAEVFASNVFGLKELAKALPKPVYNEFVKGLSGAKPLDKHVADAVAHAAKSWALSHGATHYTHWFQPQTNSTAEKHDTFLDLKYSFEHGLMTAIALDSFSGSQLIQAEPDASSFPHGGSRTTFEARGYTVWDTTSPMFVQTGPHGTSILYIPSIFISYNGEALDEKTVLLRSIAAVSSATSRLLQLIGVADSTCKVFPTLGTEQEFFMVDRELYALRPDLRHTGRSLIGAAPAKHQQLEDHYFASLPSRVLAAISEAELQLWKLGVPCKTRHNEVAPAQFEMAPIFEEANVAVDHNLLTMDIFHKVAHRHKLKILYHEKPFKGVNGSGKHCNWSLCTDKGKNLLDPTANPEKNLSFLLLLVAILKAVHDHSGLLLASIASSSNEHRLGASEAPPSIVSVFLGAHLDEVLNSIEENRSPRRESVAGLTAVKVGGAVLDMKIDTLPTISRDLTDRNRTSPFAFTGNKFEFRAVGSKQSPSFPVTVLNAAVSSALVDLCDELEKLKANREFVSEADAFSVVRRYIKETKNIRFEGDGYSQEWRDEAKRRGLLNLPHAAEAFKQLLVPHNLKMLCKKCEIFSEDELKLRYHVLAEKYAKDQIIEARTLVDMVKVGILPATFKWRKDLASGIIALQQLHEKTPESAVLSKLTDKCTKLVEIVDKIEHNLDELSKTHDVELMCPKAFALCSNMKEIRDIVDSMEVFMPDELWPFPKYNEILFSA